MKISPNSLKMSRDPWGGRRAATVEPGIEDHRRRCSPLAPGPRRARGMAEVMGLEPGMKPRHEAHDVEDGTANSRRERARVRPHIGAFEHHRTDRRMPGHEFLA